MVPLSDIIMGELEDESEADLDSRIEHVLDGISNGMDSDILIELYGMEAYAEAIGL